MSRQRVVCIASLFAMTALALAQKPTVRPNGVVNAASYDQSQIAPRSLITIFGTNLANSTANAANTPLATTLGGATVDIDGIPAPLLYVSPTQINAQVPAATNTGIPRTARVVVTTAAGASDPATITISPRAFGIFTMSATGCGAGAILNVHADGSSSVNTPESSFDPTKDVALAVFGTGLGYAPGVPDGSPYIPGGTTPSGGLLTGFIGLPDASGSTQGLTSIYAGPAPGLIGEDQLNLVVPGGVSTLPQGCHIPLYATDFTYTASQRVAVSVRNGGGQCADPVPDSLGLIEFKRRLSSSSTGNQNVEDTVELTFQSAPGLHFPGIPQENTSRSGPLPPSPLACADTEPKTLDAGTISIQGGGLMLTLSPAIQGSAIVYRASLPPDSLSGGDYRVSASGGNDVGPFQIVAHVPAPIAITDTLSPGTVLNGSQLSLHWSGSDSQSVVQEQLIVQADSVAQAASATAASSDGSLSAPVWTTLFPVGSGPTYPIGPASVVVTVQPSTSHLQNFVAPGLTLGGQVRWLYESTFHNLVVQ